MSNRVINTRDQSGICNVQFAMPEHRYATLRELVLRSAPNMGANPYTGKRIGDHADADHDATNFVVDQLARGEYDAMRARPEPVNKPSHASDGATYARDDSTGAYYLQSQLARVESTMLDVYYKPVLYSKLLPVATGTGLQWDSVRYQTSNQTGLAKEISQQSDVIPTAEVSSGVNDISVTDPIAIAYQWNVLELAQSGYLKRPIDSRKAVAARNAFERALNYIALFGQKDPSTAVASLPGLFNAKYLWQNVLTSASIQSPITGAWGGVSATSTTPQQILNDLNALLTYVWTQTGFNEWPNVVLLPTTTMTPLAQIVSTAGNRSILDYLKENNVAKTVGGVNVEFVFAPGLENTNAFDSTTANGNRRVTTYTNNSDAVEFEITQPLTFLAPQYEGLMVSIPGYGRCTRGIKVKRPTNIAWMDGV